MTSRAKRLALAGAVLVLLSAAVVVPASASLPKSATTTVLAVDSSTLVAGQPIKMSVTVTGTTAVPTGTVTVKAGAATVGKIVLAAGMDGSGSLTTSTLPVGTDVLTASFAATGQFSASTSPAVTVGVTKAASRVTLTSSNLNPVGGRAGDTAGGGDRHSTEHRAGKRVGQVLRGNQSRRHGRDG